MGLDNVLSYDKGEEKKKGYALDFMTSDAWS